jgi:putative PIG3 family NAD(P)H quinone oxidoreductase
MPGGPEALVAETRALPVPQEGEILVRVRSAGVNRADLMQREGKYPPPPGASDILGLEIAGEVAAAGHGVIRYGVGDKVVALVAGGGYAEYCTVHETNALQLPKNFTVVQGGALAEALFTVWPNLSWRGRLEPRETVLIHGGSSGIGTTAIQLAKIIGAKVITTAGSAEKCAACLKLGADVAINYRTEDFVERVLAATGGRGADVILDIVGGEYITRNYRAAAEDGRIVQVSTQQGSRVAADFHLLMRKRLTHTGSTLRNRSVAFKAEVAKAVLENVWPMLETGLVAPVVDTTFPLARVADAHRRLESGDHFGKVILTVE